MSGSSARTARRTNAVGGHDEQHFVTTCLDIVLKPLKAGHELRVAEFRIAEQAGGDQATALLLQLCSGVTGFDQDQRAHRVGIKGIVLAQLGDALTDQAPDAG